MSGRARAALAPLAGLIALFALLALWQRNAYWSYSDGVYALSARELLHGLWPYRDFVAAQPPPVYLLGAALLAIHDGLASLRAGLALVGLVTAGLVGWSVWRLAECRRLAWASAFAAPLLPISLTAHAQLVPETLAAPLLLGGTVVCAGRRRAVLGSGLLALAAFCKLAFGLPAFAIVAVSARRSRAIGGLVLTGCVLAGASLAAFGTGVWRQVVRAQLQVGSPPLHYVGGLLAQAAWSEFVLVLGAVAALGSALRTPALTHDRDLMRTVAASALGGIVLALTVFKRGSYINVLAVAEPPLLVLAVCGAAWSWRRRAGRLVVVLLGALLALQSLSILTSPADPWAAKRPGARSGLSWTAGPAAVDRAVAQARRCPSSRAYAGDPYIAFLAGRRMPGNQPDPFMLAYAAGDAGLARRAAGDAPRCPRR